MNLTLKNLYDEFNENNDEKKFLDVHKTISKLINKIVEARIKMNLTQRDLEKISGVKQSAIARFETLQVIPKIDTILNLMYHLNIDLKLICNKDEQKVISSIPGSSNSDYKVIIFKIENKVEELDYKVSNYQVDNFNYFNNSEDKLGMEVN